MSGIVTLTMNPAVDVSMCVDHVEPTRKLRCAEVRRDPGGGGVNVARVLRRFGLNVTALFTVGGLTGRTLERLLDAEDIRRLPVPISEETREDFNVLDQSTGEQFRFVTPGPHLKRREWTAARDLLAALDPKPRYVCVSGSLPPGAPDDFYADIARVVEGWNGRLVLDTSGPALRAAIGSRIFLLKPSLTEMEALAGVALTTREAQVSACRGLIETSGVERVALSLGAAGALLVTAEGAWFAAALPIPVTSAVGAGDSFLGCMLVALADDARMETCLRYGVAGGSAALRAPGTGLCPAEEVRRLLNEVRVCAV